jgi:hypothetical protein
MNAQLPKFMTIKDFCNYTGFTKYQFWRFAKKTNLSIKDLGTGMGNDWRGLIVDVAAALAAIEALPECDKEAPINLLLVEVHQAEAEAVEEAEAAE